MDEFCCINCDYSTSRQANYNRHLKSAKHLKKEIGHQCSKKSTTGTQHQRTTNAAPTQSLCTPTKFKCDYCNSNYTRIDSLTRHYKTCIVKNNEVTKLKNELDTQIKILQNENKKYKHENDRYKKESKYFQAENDYHKQMLNEAGGLVKKSVSALTYVAHNYGSAPTIEMLDVDDMEDLEENNKKLVEDIISAHRHKP